MHKKPVDKIIPCGFKMENGDNIAQQIIHKNEIPRTIFVAKDSCTIGAMIVFKKHGYVFPKEIAKAGFTESSLEKHTAFSLSSVEQPIHDIGQKAAKLLLDQIDKNGIFVPQTMVLNGRLKIRDSSL